MTKFQVAATFDFILVVFGKIQSIWWPMLVT